MSNEHFLIHTELSVENIENYIMTKNEVNELTCLVPKDNQSESTLLKENGFRYCGKRLVEGKAMIVFKWFRGLDDKYEDMRSFFNRRACDYDLHMSDGNDSYETTFISLVEDIHRTNDKIAVLDLGCGTGAELKYIFQRSPNAHVVCMDVAEEMLYKLLDDYSDHTSNIEIVCASYLGFDFGEKRYDYVVSCSTLHHILAEDKQNLYASIKKGLKEKGFLLISDYIASNLQEEQSLRANYLDLVDRGIIDRNGIYHIDLPLTMDHEVDLLEVAGFTVTRVERTGDTGAIISAHS
jgi:tRNA (cmo5U34)-methyltransferase